MAAFRFWYCLFPYPLHQSTYVCSYSYGSSKQCMLILRTIGLPYHWSRRLRGITQLSRIGNVLRNISLILESLQCGVIPNRLRNSLVHNVYKKYITKLRSYTFPLALIVDSLQLNKKSHQFKTLEECSLIAKEIGIHIDEDDPDCQAGKEQAKKIFQEIHMTCGNVYNTFATTSPET